MEPISETPKPAWTPLNEEKLNGLNEVFKTLRPYPEKLRKNGTKAFKICGQKFIWTYPTHLDKEALYRWFIDHFLFTGEPFKFFRCAHETGKTIGDKFPYEHTHVVVDFGKQIDKTVDVTYLDIYWPGYIPAIEGRGQPDILHPNLGNIGTAKHWKNTIQYITKEDPANFDLRAPFVPNLAEGIAACESDQEAVKKYMKRPGDAKGIVETRKIMNGGVVDEAWINYEDLTMPWMTQFIEHCDRPIMKPEIMPRLPREEWGKTKIGHLVKRHASGKIDWIISEGCQGKNVTSTALMIHDPQRFFCLDYIPQKRELANLCKGAREKGWCGHTIVFCLSRQDIDYKIYGPLESIRDNGISGDKYEGFNGRWKAHNVVVFANWLPDLRKLTLDKWNIWKIDTEFLTLETVSLDSALDAYKVQEQTRLASKLKERQAELDAVMNCYNKKFNREGSTCANLPGGLLN